MKRIMIRAGEARQFQTRTILENVLARPRPNQAITPVEMRKRCDVLRAMDGAVASFLLEDDQHKLLAELVAAYPWGVAHKDLLEIIDDVEFAETVAVRPVADAAE